MTLSVSRFLLITLVLFFVNNTFAQPPSPSPQMLAANKLFDEENWTEAAKAYEQIVKAQPKNPRAWLMLGRSRLALKQYQPAITAFEENIAITNNPLTMVKLAGAYAQQGQKDKALEWLGKAVKSENPLGANLSAERELDPLRADSQFKELALIAERKQKPCEFLSEARQFDFWIGEWDVFTLQGQKGGTSKIEKISSGCGILENWTNSIGLAGKSINFFDPYTKKWYQYWMGSDGVPIRFEGTFSDNAMRYMGESITPEGKKTLNRLTFFNLDRNTVRQLGEDSEDGGKTWTVSYDLKYVRRST